MAIFAGIEAIDSTEIEDTFSEDMSSLLLDVMVKDSEISEDLEAINTMTFAEEKFDASFEQLEALESSIEEFGISKAVVKAVDPGQYLAKNGIIPSYENLNDLPTKDETSEMALEGIGESIKNAWKKIKEFMKKLWLKIKGFFSKIFQSFQDYEKVLKNLKKKLGEVNDFDDKKYKDKKFKILKKEDFEKGSKFVLETVKSLVDPLTKSAVTLVTDFNKVKGELAKIPDESGTNSITAIKYSMKYEKAANKLYKKYENSDDLIKYVGIEIEEEKVDDKTKYIVKSKSDKLVLNDLKEDRLKDHGYTSIDDIAKCVDIGIGLISSSKLYETEIKTLDNVYKTFDTVMKDATNNLSDDTAKARQMSKNISYVKSGISSTTKIANTFMSVQWKYVKAAIAIANAGLSVATK